jgi:hypothetical protein
MTPPQTATAEPETQAETAPESATPAPATEKPAAPDLLGGDEAAPPETKTDGDTVEDAKPATYDIKAPEGAPFADGALDEIKSFAAEHKLSPEQAQAVTDRYAAALTEAQTRHEDSIKETFSTWQEQVRTDKTWGGPEANQKQTAAYFAKAIDFAAPGYRQSLRDAGAMLEPALYFALAKFGKQMSEPGNPEVSNTNPPREQGYAASFPNTPKSLGGSKQE